MKRKWSVICSLLIFLLTMAALAMMMTGFSFSGGPVMFSAERIAAFRYFTVDSNVLMAVMALTGAVFALRRPEAERPRWLVVLTYVATVAVSVTMCTVVFFLAPVMKRGFVRLFSDCNLFFHLIVPALSILTLVCFGGSKELKFKHTFLGLLPTAIYAVFYAVHVFGHLEQGAVSPAYDWYGMCRFLEFIGLIVIDIVKIIIFCVK